MQTKRLFLAFLAVAALPCGLYAQYKGSVPPPSEYQTGWDQISAALARQHLGYLAGPECQGRGSGQPGFYKAAEYVAARFKEMGLVPIGENGTYFQGVPFSKTSVDESASGLTGPSIDLKIGKGLGGSLTGDADVSVEEVVFIKLPTTLPTALPEGLSVQGKAVVVASATPLDFRTRNLFIQGGAAMVITVVEKAPAPFASVSPGNRTAGGGRAGRAPALSIDRRYALDLARALGVDPTMVVAGSTDSDGVEFKEAKGALHLTVKVKTEQIMVPNVVGMLPGSDPVLKEQYIGVGAHLDHLGVNASGVVYPGADDDGSGSTAMLMIAKAATSNPVKPRRSVVFMAFCGEEMGLIGSGYYTANPLIPLDRMDCLLQMDMVGRNEEKPNENPPEKAEDNINTIHLVGSKRISMELHNVVIDMNKYLNFAFEYDEEGVYERSDHANFARKGVPITFLFSGFHPDYHQPTDTIDKINWDKIVSTARLNYLVLETVGGMTEMLKHDAGG